MPMMILNLALLFVFGLASIQLSFINREDLPHGASEFGGRLLDLVNRCRHGARYSFYGAGSNVAFRNSIEIGLIESIRPLTLNFLSISVRGNRSLPFREYRNSHKWNCGLWRFPKIYQKRAFLDFGGRKKINVQSIGKPTKDFFICSFWDSNISESILLIIWLGVKLIGSSGRGVSATVGALVGSGVVGVDGSDSGWMTNGFWRRNWLSVYQNSRAKTAAITARPNVQAIKIL